MSRDQEIRIEELRARVDELTEERDRLRALIVQADSICSLILYRESRDLSPQTLSDLEAVVSDMRRESR